MREIPATISGEVTMKSIALILLSTAIASMLHGTAAPAEDNDDKVVKYCWFPRFSPDGKTLLVPNGSGDSKEGGEIRLFATQDGQVQRVIKNPRGMCTGVWSSKGTFIVTGDYGGDIRTFDIKTGKLLKTISNSKHID